MGLGAPGDFVVHLGPGTGRYRCTLPRGLNPETTTTGAATVAAGKNSGDLNPIGTSTWAIGRDVGMSGCRGSRNIRGMRLAALTQLSTQLGLKGGGAG